MPLGSRILIPAMLCIVLCAPARAEEAWDPWTLDEVIAPEWLSLRVEHRTRFEYFDHQFRSIGPDHGDLFALRTRVDGRVRLGGGFTLGAELQDSRVEAAGDVRLNASMVNSVELLRGYLEFHRADVLGGSLQIQGGRLTMDVGSRRFVARNRYRNTSNAFTGVDVQWTHTDGTHVRAFWTLPVLRLPRDQPSLQNNHIRNDEESIDRQFWGLFASRPFAEIGTGELFVFGLHERDDPDRVTRRRELITPGFRVFRAPDVGHWDYQIETALQFGTSRVVSGSRRRDHFAHFHHAEVGYTFDRAWSPRLVLQYDYASGDDQPGDGENDRFDTLFGARRFDFGPTGIYGPFVRSNLHTPGLRLQLKPAANLTSFLAFRAYWLADRDDLWVAAAIADPGGDADPYLGSQFEIRVRYRILPENVMIEGGYAHLFDGNFADEAGIGRDGRDVNYLYTQILIAF